MTDRTPHPPEPVGTSGLNRSGYTIWEEWDRRLQGARGVRMYREMSESDASLGGALFALTTVFGSNGYAVEPKDASPAAKAVSDFVASCFDDMEGSIATTWTNMLTDAVYGYAPMETRYKVRLGPTLDPLTSSASRDGRIGWAAWELRPPDTILGWDFGPDGRATHLIQQAPPDWRTRHVPLLPTPGEGPGCLLFRIRARKNSPEGVSLLRNAFESYYFKKNLNRIEAIMIERAGAGFPVGKVPANVIASGGATYQSWQEMLANIRVDEQAGVLMPSDPWPNTSLPMYAFEFAAPSGSVQLNTDVAIGRHDRAMLRAFLADFLTLGDTGVGSYAQSVSRIDLWRSALHALHALHADEIQATAILRLLMLNQMPLELAPTFRFNDVGDVDVLKFAQAIALLAQPNVAAVDASDPGVRGYVADVLDLPAPTEQGHVARPASATPSQPPMNGPQPSPNGQTPPAPVPQPSAASGARRFVEAADLAAAEALFNGVVDPRYDGLLSAEILPATGA